MLKPEKGIGSLAFVLFLLLTFSLGLMKPPIEAGFATLTPTDLIFPLFFICWLVALATGQIRLQWRQEYLAFAFYFVALLVSAIFSINQRLSFVKLVGAAYLILLAVMTPTVVTTLERLRLFCLAWVAGSIPALIAALFAIILFYFLPDSSWLSTVTYHYGAVPVGNFPRISSTFVSASMFCNYLTVTLVITLVSARMGWIRNWFATALTAAIGVAAMFTVSIALGGFVLAAGLWIWLMSPKKVIGRTALALAGVISLAFLAMAPFALSLQSAGSLFEQLSPSSRALVWRDALSTFLTDPLTGSGIGTAVANVVFQNYDGTWSLLTDAHNMFLNVAAQAGLLGLIGIVAVVIAISRRALATGREEKNYLRDSFAIAFFSAFVYDGLTGSFEDVRYLWILIGIILSANRITNDGSTALNRA